jgi:hypothetical protein
MAEIIRFETNIPIECAFTHTDGKETEGRFGTQYYRQTTDGRTVYLIPFVETRLLDLEIQPGELVSICKKEVKDGRKRGIQWEVRRVDPPGDPSQSVNAKPPVQNSTASKPESPKLAVRSIPSQSPKPGSPSPNNRTTQEPEPQVLKKPAAQETAPQIKSPGLTQLSSMLAGSYIAGIDALLIAKDYAKSKGIPADLTLELTGEDLQKLATSAFIAISEGRLEALNLRNRNNDARAANGGTSWPH